MFPLENLARKGLGAPNSADLGNLWPDDKLWKFILI